jgi:GNAT superfamily N-acetyltransferase
MTEVLEDGWSAQAPETDSLLRGYVRGFATMMADIGRAVGGRVLETDDVVAVDTGADFFLANGAALRHPVRDDRLPAIADALHDFYAAGPGVSWVLMSAWPIPPIARMGLVGHPPFMIRSPGGAAPPLPAGLEIREAVTEADMVDFARALEGYPAPHTDVFANGRLVDVPGMHWYVASLDGRPVGCSAAHVGDACVDVEFVATHEDARGRGIGAAVTWAATLADPAKPAVLIASDPGQPVYERMGYLRVMRLTMWGAGPASP